MNTPSTLLQLQPGTAVVYQNRLHRITHVLDLDEVLLVDDETNQVSHAKVGALEAVVGGTQSVVRPDLVQVLDKDWEEAKRRYEIIRPLLDKADRSRQDVTERGKACDLHTNTLYEWIRRYEDSHLLTSLLPRIRNDKGSTKLTPEVETIIQAVVESEYLTKQRKSQQKVCDEVRKRCLYAGIEPPHDNTVRNRLKLLAGEHVMAKRRGRKAADQAYSPIEGSFPGADWPLAVVQIDHTPLDIILVDDIDRRPVNKPWITLAIDVFSRMVVGFYVSFDPPGTLSAGQCLASAILPKESWLAKHDIKGEWPCWGMPSKLHMDNAREFRGNMLKRACDQYGIDIEWRPVARPHFGGHIERLLGTFAKEIHTLPGTTFSNVRERGDYDSEGKAALTLTELEEWLVTFIVNVYHQRAFLNVLKYLGNELQVPIVAVGTRDAFRALQTDPQLANRFEPALLPRWEFDTDFLRLLASFERMLPLREPSALHDTTLATKLFSMSEGYIGELSRLLTSSAVHAVETGQERIDERVLNGIDWVSPSDRKRKIDQHS